MLENIMGHFLNLLREKAVSNKLVLDLGPPLL